MIPMAAIVGSSHAKMTLAVARKQYTAELRAPRET
jgi:hypothetical protein